MNENIDKSNNKKISNDSLSIGSDRSTNFSDHAFESLNENEVD